jgi:hypothetical protein
MQLASLLPYNNRNDNNGFRVCVSMLFLQLGVPCQNGRAERMPNGLLSLPG